MSNTSRNNEVMKYCFGDDAEFVAVKHYERLQRELTEAQDKIEELVETGLTQMDKERSLKRELDEVRKQRDIYRKLLEKNQEQKKYILELEEKLDGWTSPD
jgi:hypothetical protein